MQTMSLIQIVDVVEWVLMESVPEEVSVSVDCFLDKRSHERVLYNQIESGVPNVSPRDLQMATSTILDMVQYMTIGYCSKSSKLAYTKVLDSIRISCDFIKNVIKGCNFWHVEMVDSRLGAKILEGIFKSLNKEIRKISKEINSPIKRDPFEVVLTELFARYPERRSAGMFSRRGFSVAVVRVIRSYLVGNNDIEKCKRGLNELMRVEEKFIRSRI